MMDDICLCGCCLSPGEIDDIYRLTWDIQLPAVTDYLFADLERAFPFTGESHPSP